MSKVVLNKPGPNFLHRLISPIALSLFVMMAWPAQSTAHHFVEKHNLRCGPVFPCPPDLQRRVDFWIKVFRSWNTNELVFHDSSKPERVYRIVKSKYSCRGRRSKATINHYKSKIRKDLKNIAWKLDKKKQNWTKTESHLLALFPSKRSRNIRRALNTIRCQQGNRDRFAEALQRFGTYRHLVEKILTEAGLPDDIKYLPFVESAYNPKAYSKAGAAGLWQIMPRTARTLGLQLSATIDERRDAEMATRGAAKYLTDSTKVLTLAARSENSAVTSGEINPFVITSYNYGVNGMRRAIHKLGPDYMTVLNKYKSRQFQTAVRNFYSSFLAARYVAQNARRYFGKVIEAQPLRYKTILINKPTSIKRVQGVFGVSEDRLKELNQALTRYVWHGWRFIPKGYRLRLPYRKDGYAVQVASLKKLPAEAEQWNGTKYRVKRGDTACGIASAFRVNCRTLIAVNGLNRRGFIRVGQRLTIPGKVPTASASVAGKYSVDSTGQPYYIVRRGDTACKIARRFRVNCRQLIQFNSLGAGALIMVGQRVNIPKQPVTVASVGKQQSGKSRTPAARTANTVAKSKLVKNIPPPVLPATESVGSFNAVLDNEIDVSVRKRQAGSKTRYYIYVEADETLGHYADWLGIGSTSKIRQLNRLRSRQNINSGQRIYLPVTENKRVDRFNAKRQEYHRVLVELFKENFDITGVNTYKVKRGDSVWRIAKKTDLPIWIVSRFNPRLRRQSPMVGEVLTLPVFQAKTSG